MDSCTPFLRRTPRLNAPFGRFSAARTLPTHAEARRERSKWSTWIAFRDRNVGVISPIHTEEQWRSIRVQDSGCWQCCCWVLSILARPSRPTHADSATCSAGPTATRFKDRGADLDAGGPASCACRRAYVTSLTTISSRSLVTRTTSEPARRLKGAKGWPVSVPYSRREDCQAVPRPHASGRPMAGFDPAWTVVAVVFLKWVDAVAFGEHRVR